MNLRSGFSLLRVGGFYQLLYGVFEIEFTAIFYCERSRLSTVDQHGTEVDVVDGENIVPGKKMKIVKKLNHGINSFM